MHPRTTLVLAVLLLSCTDRPLPDPDAGGTPQTTCVSLLPVPTACTRSSDCYRNDLCASHDCVAGACAYAARVAEKGEPVTCDPGRPEGGRWACQGADQSAPWGYCCQVAPGPAVTR